MAFAVLLPSRMHKLTLLAFIGVTLTAGCAAEEERPGVPLVGLGDYVPVEARLLMATTATDWVGCESAIPMLRRTWFYAEDGYTITRDAAVVHRGQPSNVIRARPSLLNGWRVACADQPLDVSALAGRRIRITTYLKTEAAGTAHPFVRFPDLSRDSLGYIGFIQGRILIGTNDFTPMVIVVDVPADAREASFGTVLTDGGAVWTGAVDIEVVGRDVPLTGGDA